MQRAIRNRPPRRVHGLVLTQRRAARLPNSQPCACLSHLLYTQGDLQPWASFAKQVSPHPLTQFRKTAASCCSRNFAPSLTGAS